MCYCTPEIKTPCCGEKCHAFLGEQAAPCPWHAPWVDKPKGALVMADILKMIETIRNDKKLGPFTMHLYDATLRAIGYDPNDYPELEGEPGVRVISAQTTKD
jgi:hypothetical protein